MAVRDKVGEKKVHAVGLGGHLKYNRLIDDGTNVIRFEGGFGFLARDQLRPLSLVLVDGWRAPRSPQSREEDQCPDARRKICEILAPNSCAGMKPCWTSC